MVAVGSFKREDLKSTFDVTDYKNKLALSTQASCQIYLERGKALSPQAL
ncbi:hypothetical protein BSPWISOXPB_2799 [uncultured Gammaproteobacteria bacterium]|nr:hypothetical protein BSPWISOXPB_2799 [uncultured Gammaproteobacteria bacterium]